MILSNNRLFALFLSTTVFATSCSDKKEADAKGGNKAKNLSAEGYVASAGVFNSDYNASGSLVANEEIDIHPEMAGRVTSINFKEGSKVHKGQLLIQLYDGEITAQIQKLKSQLRLQQNTLQRQKELLNIGGISKQDYETSETQVQSIQADISYAEAQLRATRVLAPFDGTIGIRNISVGAIVSPTTLITSLKQTQQLKMDFNVPEQYVQSIAIGKGVFFVVTGNNDTLSGKISAIDPGADATTRTIRVRAIVPNNNGKLVAGSFANVTIPLKSDKNAILIPSQAIIPTTKDKKVAIAKDGKIAMAVVKLGQRTEDKVEILTGVSAGDTVILTGLMQAKPGMDVKIVKVRS
ncbi:MAG: efflux RND transporter periplasmic adaptor subunit [Bacteroidetes bacterium]|nr:efflux RND transporter periplasmic adaptor subunit [Bacteroidota bacterium]